MALVDVVRAGVKIASGVTKSFQDVVTHQAWIGQDGAGRDRFAAAVTRRALVDRTTRNAETSTDVLVTVVATLTFLDPVLPTTPETGQVRANPIDPRDIFTLTDGTTAPVVSGGGLQDAGAGVPFVSSVVLGRERKL